MALQTVFNVAVMNTRTFVLKAILYVMINYSPRLFSILNISIHFLNGMKRYNADTFSKQFLYNFVSIRSLISMSLYLYPFHQK